jgi:hypothetical protein
MSEPNWLFVGKPDAESDLCHESPRERWRRAYREVRLQAQRARIKKMAPRIFNGAIGTIYSVKVIASRRLQGE